jgi:hypothetical protein
MSAPITSTHERTDDMPVIIAVLLQRRVAAWIDTPCPTHGHGTGVRLGQRVVVWCTWLLAAGVHRRAPVAPWVAAPHPTRRRSWPHEGLPRDGTAARWATGLEDLRFLG